jgi:hypothetical protein
MRIHFLALALWASVGTAGAQSVELVGPAGQHHTLTRAELQRLPHREVKASAHGVSGNFAGAALGDVLKLVGAPAGDSLRGAALASYVLVEAADGYRVVFSPAEFDAGYTDKVILLVDTKDGVALDAHDGPFQLIVPDEKRPARWVRQVTRISVVRLPPAK